MASRTKVGGGSIQQSIDYLYPGQGLPTAVAGKDLLTITSDTISRPRIDSTPMNGGFLPSVMKGVMNGAAVVGPLAFMAGKRLINNTRRRGGGKMENWARNRQMAKDELLRYGKPGAANIQKYAALKRKLNNPKFDKRVILNDIKVFLKDYKTRKVAKAAKKATRKAPKAKAAAFEFNNKKGKLIPFRNDPNLATRRRDNAAARAARAAARLAADRTAVTTRVPVPVPVPVSVPLSVPVSVPVTVAPALKTVRSYTKKNTGTNWRTLQERARKILSQYGKPKATNIARYASTLRGTRPNGLAPETVLSEFQMRVLPPPVSEPEPVATGLPPPPLSKAEALRANKNAAKTVLSAYGKPSGRDVITFTALSRKRTANANTAKKYNDFLRNYQTRKAKAAFRPISEETARASSSF
jgi:hypothetical protein